MIDKALAGCNYCGSTMFVDPQGEFVEVDELDPRADRLDSPTLEWVDGLASCPVTYQHEMGYCPGSIEKF